MNEQFILKRAETNLSIVNDATILNSIQMIQFDIFNQKTDQRSENEDGFGQ